MDQVTDFRCSVGTRSGYFTQPIHKQVTEPSHGAIDAAPIAHLKLRRAHDADAAVRSERAGAVPGAPRAGDRTGDTGRTGRYRGARDRAGPRSRAWGVARAAQSARRERN